MIKHDLLRCLGFSKWPRLMTHFVDLLVAWDIMEQLQQFLKGQKSEAWQEKNTNPDIGFLETEHSDFLRKSWFESSFCILSLRLEDIQNHTLPIQRKKQCKLVQKQLSRTSKHWIQSKQFEQLNMFWTHFSWVCAVLRTGVVNCTKGHQMKPIPEASNHY